MNNTNKSNNAHQPADFFVLRSPKLSLSHLATWQDSDRKQLRRQLRLWLETPETQEALYIASPSLLQRIEQWYDDPDSKKGKKLELALAKYFIRMAGRATPFGLFSGISKGTVKQNHETQLSLNSKIKPKRKTRLDMYYLLSVKESLCNNYWQEKNLPLVANHSVYKVGEQFRYIESYYSNEQLHYRLSSVEYCHFTQAILIKSQKGAYLNDLIDLICKTDKEISSAEATEFIGQLVDARLLHPVLALPLTCDGSDKTFANNMLNAGFDKNAQYLSGAIEKLEFIDSAVTNKVSYYQNILESLKELPFKVQENKMFQVDSFFSNPNLNLNSTLCNKIIDDIALLQSINGIPANPLQDVIKKINSDYVGRMMPLQEFLDDENGLAMGSAKAFATPLLKGLDLTNFQHVTATTNILPIDRLLMKMLTSMDYAHQVEITLDKKEIKKLSASKNSSMPDSMAVMIQLFKGETEEAPQIFYKGCYGPSAANLLGRFCHLDDTLQAKVKGLLKKEELCRPKAIFAEIVHLPEGRIGNVIARPILRQYEIPFLSDAGVDDEFQIELSDLYIYVEDSKLKLWSKHYNKEVIPRLSSAHNYSARSLGIYKFLCMLQNQETNLPRFNWPSFFESASYLPRVKLGDMILSKRRWRIERKELEILVKSEMNRERIELLENKTQLPDWVSYSVSDNTLLINLNNPIMLDVLLAETKGKTWVVLEEVLDFELTPLASLDGKALKHEIILPLSKEPTTEVNNVAKTTPITPQHLNASSALRSFGPGSEWLSIKVYLGNSSAEKLLVDVISPLIDEFKQKALIQGFFFLRYSDPDWHIRLRFNGEPQTLLTKVLPQLHQIIEPLRLSGLVNNLVIDTYEQEVERYGGVETIKFAEQLFFINSQQCLTLLNYINDLPDEYRWRFVLLGCDHILTSFKFNITQKLEFITQLRDGFGREFGDSTPLRKELGKKYRQYQDIIKADFNAEAQNETAQRLWKTFTEKQPDVADLVEKYQSLELDKQLTQPLSSIISAILHMFNNRMFVAYGRQQEFVVYDLLRRYYEYKYNLENKRNR